MGCILSCLACNAASCLCSGACNCFGKVVPMSLFAGRIAYTVMFFLVSFIAWIFRGWAKNILDWVPELKVCGEGTYACYGALAVYRISFGLALFHLIMALMTIGVKNRGDCRNALQDGFWLIKVNTLFVHNQIAALIGIIIGGFFIPNEFFEIYGWVAVFASGIFIVVQLIYLVDFAHTWAESWISKHEDREDEDSHFWWWMLLLSSVFMFGLALAGTILMYIFFTKDAACGINVFFISLNVVFCILISAASIHPKVQEVNERSGLLQPALITAYCTYLIFSSIQSEQDGCNPFNNAAAANNVSLLIGALFTICAVCYSTVRAASRTDSLEANAEEREPLTKEDKEGDEESQKEVQDPNEPVGYNFSRFHIIFALGAMYLSMLMTDWHTISGIDDASTPVVDAGPAAVWVKVVSSWVCILLYGWTLAGPILLPDRDWS